MSTYVSSMNTLECIYSVMKCVRLHSTDDPNNSATEEGKQGTSMRISTSRHLYKARARAGNLFKALEHRSVDPRGEVNAFRNKGVSGISYYE